MRILVCLILIVGFNAHGSSSTDSVPLEPLPGVGICLGCDPENFKPDVVEWQGICYVTGCVVNENKVWCERGVEIVRCK